MKNYFDKINNDVDLIYTIANKARKRNLDPVSNVEIPLARNMAERVVGLISIVAPQIRDTKVVSRIQELEFMYGKLDWRVSLKIAEETAQEKFCKFSDKKEAMEVGIRIGIAYVTNGVVSSPIEGFTNLKIRKRKDGKEYFALFFSGPIRSAGGTAASVAVIIGDYIRKKMGYSEYDPTEEEIKRLTTELGDYHERVTNLQYFPSAEELEYIVRNLTVQIDGDPSEKFDVSNYKDLERIETNKIRNGPCLVLGEGICQKAAKLWKQLNKWGNDFGLEHWKFLENFLEIQKKIKSKKIIKDGNEKIKPDFTYIKDLVAGRPVLSHPLRNGGFRLRYGRCRNTGLSSVAINPATMKVLNDYIAIGTQIKLERPSKGASLSSCDSIDGPIVKLRNGDVLFLDTYEKACKYYKDVEEILFLGDILISYGDFFNRAHSLVPCGYNEDYWLRQFEYAIINKFGSLNFDEASKILNIDKSLLENIFSGKEKYVNVDVAIIISRRFNIPLHPRWAYYWNSITKKEFIALLSWLIKANIDDDKVVLPFIYDLEEDNIDPKRALELIGIQHKVISNEFVVIEGDDSRAFVFSLCGLTDIKGIKEIAEYNEDVLTIINKICEVEVKDKLGTFIGARMGRPEKAKKRKLKGSPNVLFPVGEEGGKQRSLMSTLTKGKIIGDFPCYYCNKCNEYTIYSFCIFCNEKTELKFYCGKCDKYYEENNCDEHGKCKSYRKQELDIKKYFNQTLKFINVRNVPEMIKGVRGTSNEDHTIENLAKGVLRALYGLEVNKDGTTRFDATELAITHFKAKEIGTSIERLKELGYEKDVYGNDIFDDEQIIELKCQDVILPACSESLEDGADKVMLRLGNFIDDLLEKFYKIDKFYNFKKKEDLVGHYILAIAPHISAGIIGRIIGFSNTQGFYAHPYFHCAVRRDADGDELAFTLLLDPLLNFSRKYLPAHRGATQDAPLVLTTNIIPSEIDDMVFDMDIIDKYPLELYEAAEQYKMPWDVKIEQVKNKLGTENEYGPFYFTHDTTDINLGVICSAYKKLPTMKEKVIGQFEIAEKIRAVDQEDVARLVIERHFIRDIRGNLRKFSQQEFRCSSCNSKYRRPPLKGSCLKCNGNIIFTVSFGNIVKYLESTLSLANKYSLPKYLKQTLELTKERIESEFGKDADRQEGLGRWF